MHTTGCMWSLNLEGLPSLNAGQSSSAMLAVDAIPSALTNTAQICSIIPATYLQHCSDHECREPPDRACRVASYVWLHSHCSGELLEMAQILRVSDLMTS